MVGEEYLDEARGETCESGDMTLFLLSILWLQDTLSLFSLPSPQATFSRG